MRCTLCGDTKRLNEYGVCEYRPGCDHRVMVADAIVERLMSEPECVGYRYVMWTEHGNMYKGIEYLYSDGSSCRQIEDVISGN